MSGGDEFAGGQLADATRPQPVQPLRLAGRDLEAPVLAADVLQNMAPAFADETRRLQENLERRAADQELLRDLAVHDFTGTRYKWFEEELARYGISVLRGWMHSGWIFKLARKRGFELHPSDEELEELLRDSDVREELANMTVGLALPRFKKHALVGGGWRYDGGASLATYFVGSCLYVFPNEFRKRRVQQRKQARVLFHEALDVGSGVSRTSDPAVLAMSNIRVHDDLQQLDGRTRAIVALTIDGYRQQEIVELLGEESVRAVEAVKYRWRRKEQRRMRKGSNHDG